MDIYVLDEDNSVLFTFLGLSQVTSTTRRSLFLHDRIGLHFTLVNQGNEWPTERYMMYWQPRIHPLSHNEGLVAVENSLHLETAELLHVLDRMALSYIHKTMK